MKKPIITAFSALIAIGAVAQNKLDISAQRTMEAYRTSLEFAAPAGPTIRSVASAGASADVYTALVTLKSPDDASALEALGYEIIDAFDNIAIIDLPLSDVDSLTAEDYVVHVSFGGQARPLMDKARAASGVDDVTAGTGLKQPYTGKGVYVSLFDTGLDPNHINFKDQEGNTRVIAIDKITGTNGAEARFTTAAQIRNFTTDKATETHGTHVLGMITGAYKGDVEYNRTTGPNPYYGVATDAEIIVGCGDLYNTNILKGVKYARDIAVGDGRPAVVNLSLGSNSGPHDGSSSMNQTLANYGKDVIIVISAGNEGDIPMGVMKTFTNDETEFTTSILPSYATATGTASTAANFTGDVTFYSNDKTPFKLTVAVANSRGTVSSTYVLDKSTSGRVTKLNGTNLTNFDKAYSSSSYMNVSSNVSTSNNRYGATISFSLDASSSSSRYIVAFIIEGQPGQVINGYANGTSYASNGQLINAIFSDRGVSDWTDGSCNGSINDMACGDNVICVGSYNTRKNWPTIKGTTNGYSYIVEGDISDFSSYGTLYNGTNLPHVVAPGCYVMSSWSKYNIDAGYSTSGMGATVTADGRANYWGPMQGTSMAAPFAAGVFALWLEADPTLTVADVKDIAMTTAKRDSYVEAGDPVQWGAGKLDALAGIKEVLKRADAGVGSIIADATDKKLIVEELGGNVFSAFLAGCDGLNASLYSLGGQRMLTASAADDEVTVDASALAPGIYILSVEGGNARESAKILVR